MRPGYNTRTGLSIIIPHCTQETARRHATGSIQYLIHRRLVWIAFVLIGLIGAPGIASAAPPIVEAEDTGGSGGATSAETQNQQATARLFDEVFSQQKPGVCLLLMSANAVNHTPVGDFVGPTGFERYVAELWTAYPDATFAAGESVADGDRVTATWTLSGSQTNDAGQLNGHVILRFERNMIAESWIVYGSQALVSTGQDEVTPAPEICPPCREP
jgi:predicted SnoaL-like aldol condensation-catalyzing enzyme